MPRPREDEAGSIGQTKVCIKEDLDMDSHFHLLTFLGFSIQKLDDKALTLKVIRTRPRLKVSYMRGNHAMVTKSSPSTFLGFRISKTLRRKDNIAGHWDMTKLERVGKAP